MADLEQPCVDCNGSGVSASASWAWWFALSPLHNFTAPEPNEPEELMCIECEGRRFIPTTEGLELLTFLRRYTIQST